MTDAKGTLGNLLEIIHSTTRPPEKEKGGRVRSIARGGTIDPDSLFRTGVESQIPWSLTTQRKQSFRKHRDHAESVRITGTSFIQNELRDVERVSVLF